MNKFICFAILSLTISITNADETIEDGRFWLTYNVDYKINDDWKVALQLQPRWRDEGSKFDQMVYRPSAYYKLSPQMSVGIGYAYVLTHPANNVNTHEQRLWQDFIYKTKLANWHLSSRTRFEQRHLEGFDDTGYRLREQVKLTLPLAVNPKFSLVMFDELLIHMNNTDWKVNRGMDQNRAFLGLGYHLSEQAEIEFGYLNQSINTRNVDRENHIASFTLNNHF